MGKNNTYYFIARNKKTNDFNIVDIGNSLEDIDLYTINFTGNPQLIKDLKSKGKIVDEDVDIYIVLPKKENNEKNLYYMDILYSDSLSRSWNISPNIAAASPLFISSIISNIGLFGLL